MKGAQSESHVKRAPALCSPAVTRVLGARRALGSCCSELWRDVTDIAGGGCVISTIILHGS